MIMLMKYNVSCSVRRPLSIELKRICGLSEIKLSISQMGA
ncbi:hypothetical protein SAMN04490200_3463 [Pseudomonas proteolytica]|nr:hypothetical protein SAMN04490200_3463 [Pseudomonas proteolytica]